jgi:hypothetical protein
LFQSFAVLRKSFPAKLRGKRTFAVRNSDDSFKEQSRCFFPLTVGCQLSMIFGIEVPSLKIKVMPEKIFIENIWKGFSYA